MSGVGGPDGASSSQFLRFIEVKKSYDQRQLVVKGFNLDVARGEFITLLGPSGSGKTTILMMLAGFEGVTGGDIQINGVPITRTAPYKRNIGMVFQNYALFPHMTVAENLAYPLKVRKKSRQDVANHVEEYLELVELKGYGTRHPGQLSGGQRQRVALARALIFEPSLVLMDEPLGALDKKLREQMQFEITQLHKKLGFTVIYVTHDQTEALTMSDRIAVFNEGVVQQCATPDVLYERPRNAFVADFIGENNFIPGQIVNAQADTVRVRFHNGQEVNALAADVTEPGAECIVSVRPEKMFFKSSGQPYDDEVTAKFVIRHYVGDFVRYYFKLADGPEITVKVLNDLAAPTFADGENAQLIWQSNDCYAFRTI
ncbi:MAG: ABC transporter ATP-binding protein [Hyphomicrobiales bacterium]|nr:ABC transporter ATP-binding protein [Hyphomicrobiales bacterium]